MDLRETASLSLVGLLSHKLRTLLTMLGIIFGVAAVIAMLSIGEGAKQESLEQIRQMGISNIIVQHWEKEAGDATEAADADQNRSPGLTWDDARSIARICLLADYVTPQREVKVKAQAQDHTFRTMVVGTTPDYLTVLDARMGSGVFFSTEDLNTAKRVCVLGADAKRALFFFDNPLGGRVKIRNQWFTVIGVLEDKGAAGGKIGGVLEVRNTDEDIYVPLTALLNRFHREPGEPELTQITVKIPNSNQLPEAAAIVRTILNRRHRGVEDFKIAIPEELLRQSQKTQQIFNIVMGCIAGISLLVGGIGIMNIMLASVLERTREIGLRLAVGARQRDILAQFLVESLLVSLIGGLIGVVLGYAIPEAITLYAGWRTIVQPWTIALAFGVSAAVVLVSASTQPTKPPSSTP